MSFLHEILGGDAVRTAYSIPRKNNKMNNDNNTNTVIIVVIKGPQPEKHVSNQRRAHVVCPRPRKAATVIAVPHAPPINGP